MDRKNPSYNSRNQAGAEVGRTDGEGRQTLPWIQQKLGDLGGLATEGRDDLLKAKTSLLDSTHAFDPLAAVRQHPLTVVTSGFTAGLLLGLSPASRNSLVGASRWGFKGGTALAKLAATALRHAREHQAKRSPQYDSGHAPSDSDAPMSAPFSVKASS